jgi:hypothetical protein
MINWANTFTDETAFHMSVTVKIHCYRVTNSEWSPKKRSLGMECVVFTQKCTSEKFVFFRENLRKSNMNLDVVKHNRLYFSVVWAVTKNFTARWTVLTYQLHDTHWTLCFQQLEEQRRAEILAFPFTRFQSIAYMFLLLCKLLNCSSQKQHRLQIYKE